MNDEQSEFGKGLTYCLGLFLAHADREMLKWERDPDGVQMWFNGASDHLYDLQVDSAPFLLQKRLQVLKDKCLDWGHGSGLMSVDKSDLPTKKDKAWALDEAKDLLYELDKANGIPVEKGQWQ